MKCAVASLLILFAANTFAATAPARIDKIYLGGKEYVRLDQWSRANSFQLKWLSRNEVLVSNASNRLQFVTDSARMSFNGVTVLLSEPIRNNNGGACIAGVDLTAAIHPLLFPPKNRPRQQVKTICIDPGHGGKDPGEMAGREQEKKYTLLLAQELGEQLRKAGYNVVYTRTTDAFVDLPERPDIARRRGADLFICLHFNSAPITDVRGVEVFCMTPPRASSTNARGEGATPHAYSGNLNNAKNMVLAYELEKAIVRGTGSEDRGVKRARYWVLRDAEMPAVLVEGGFMSNPGEARKIYSASWRKQMAQAIVGGIDSYRRIVTK